MKIPCSSCNQRLEIPEELAGQTIECPACNVSLAVPAIEASPPTTSRVEVTTPQAVAPQKPTPQRKTAAPPKAASSKKSKSLIPKLAVACIASVVILSLFFVLTAKVEAPDISIHDAAGDGNIEAVKQHLAAGTDVNAKDDLTGLTPLFDAVSSGKKEVAALLIDKGADVNGKIAMGFTALHNAAGNGRYEIVELLIEKGADVNEKNDFGITPLDMAEVSAGRDEETELDYKKVDDLLRKHGGKTGEELKAEGK